MTSRAIVNGWPLGAGQVVLSAGPSVSAPTLANITLAPATIPETATPGTYVGTVLGLTSGSTWTLTDDAGGRFAKSGNNIVTGLSSLSVGSNTNYNITIRETLTGATNTPRDTSLTLTVTAASTGDFTINGPTSWSQPSNSSFYQRVSGSVDIVVSAGTGDQTAEFTVGADNIISLDKRAYVPGNSYVGHFVATDGGGDTVNFTRTVTVTSIADPEQISDNINLDFSGTAGVKLSTKSGWSYLPRASAPSGTPNQILLDGAGGVHPGDAYTGDDAKWVVLYNNSDPGSLRADILVPSSPIEYRNVQHVVLAADGDNCVVVWWKLSPTTSFTSSMTVFLRQGGVQTEALAEANVATHPNDEPIEVRYIYNATTKHLTIESRGHVDGAWVGTYDVDLSAATLTGRKFGFGAWNGGQSDPLSTTKNMVYVQALGSLEIADAPVTVPSNIATVLLDWTGTEPEGILYRMLDRVTREPTSDWIVGDFDTIDGNTISVTVNSPYLGQAFMEFAVYNDTGITIRTSSPTAFGVALPELTMGYNRGGALYFLPFPPTANWGSYCDTNSIGNVILIPFENINGTGTLTVPSGTTLTGVVWEAPDHNYISITSQPNAQTIHFDINVPPGAEYATRGFVFSGARPNRVTVVRDGVSTIGDPLWLASNDASLRTLDMQGANGHAGQGYLSDNSIYRNATNCTKRGGDYGSLQDHTYHIDVGIPTEDIISIVNEAKALYPDKVKSIGLVTPLWASDDYITYETGLFAELDPGIKVYNELGNENWSNGFSHNRLWAMAQGFAAGYYRTYDVVPVVPTYETPNAPMTPMYYGGYRNTSPALNSGDYIAFHNSTTNAYSIFRAKRNVTLGASLVSGADFDIIENTVFDNLWFAAQCWIGARHLEIKQLRRSVMGDAADLVFETVLSGQSEQPLDRHDYVLNFSPQIASEVRGLSTTFYLYDDTVLVDNSLTKEQMAADFESKLVSHGNFIEAHTQACIAKGYLPHFYEGGMHPRLYTISSDDPQFPYLDHYKATWIELENSTLIEDLEEQIVRNMRMYGGGQAFYYQGFGADWGLRKKYNNDANEHRLIGHKRGFL